MFWPQHAPAAHKANSSEEKRMRSYIRIQRHGRREAGPIAAYWPVKNAGPAQYQYGTHEEDIR
jgi:hypothetical protein